MKTKCFSCGDQIRLDVAGKAPIILELAEGIDRVVEIKGTIRREFCSVSCVTDHLAFVEQDNASVESIKAKKVDKPALVRNVDYIDRFGDES